MLQQEKQCEDQEPATVGTPDVCPYKARRRDTPPEPRPLTHPPPSQTHCRVSAGVAGVLAVRLAVAAGVLLCVPARNQVFPPAPCVRVLSGEPRTVTDSCEIQPSGTGVPIVHNFYENQSQLTGKNVIKATCFILFSITFPHCRR